jgi:hypothetical protein
MNLPLCSSRSTPFVDVMCFAAQRSGRRLFALAFMLACTESQTSQTADTINKPFTINGARVEPDSLNVYLALHRGFTSKGGEMRCAYRPLGQNGNRVFVWAICSELVAADGRLISGSGMGLPTAFTIRVDSGHPRVVGVEVPEDGNRYAPSIRRIFPLEIWPAVFADRPAAGLENYLRREATARFGLPAAAASAPRVYDLPADAESATLDSAARRVVDFLRGKLPFDQIALGDTVTLYASPEGGSGRATFRREQLRRPSAWVVRSGRRDLSLAPPARTTRLTTKVGRQLNCREQPLATKFPQLAPLPHVGTMLQPENARSCLQSWNMTLVFDTSARPRLVAAVYDQWEW